MKILATIIAFIPTLLFAQASINDVPCGAINIPVVSATNCVPTTIYKWVNATFSSGGTSNPSCGGFGITTKDVWYKFTPINNNCAILFDKAYSISHDLAAAVYDAESCSFFYSNQWCNDDDGPENYPQFQFDNLIAGATYYLRVWQYNAAIDSGSAKICIVSESTTPPTIGKTGINTFFPSTTLDVNGTVKIRGGAPGANKVLTSDASGVASWNIASYDSSRGTGFWANNSFNQPFSTSFLPLFISEIFDDGNNIVNGLFTAPATGLYHFNANASFAFSNLSSQSTIQMVLESPASVFYGTQSQLFPAAFYGVADMQVTTIVKLSKNDQVRVNINVYGTTGLQTLSRIAFRGYRVY
jgi:hypothetical protein